MLHTTIGTQALTNWFMRLVYVVNLKMLVILCIVKRIFRFIIRVDRRRLIGDLIL